MGVSNTRGPSPHQIAIYLDLDHTVFQPEKEVAEPKAKGLNYSRATQQVLG